MVSLLSRRLSVVSHRSTATAILGSLFRLDMLGTLAMLY